MSGIDMMRASCRGGHCHLEESIEGLKGSLDCRQTSISLEMRKESRLSDGKV